MAMPLATTEDDFYVFVPGITWNEYEAILGAIGDHRLRHTYSQGAFEFRRELVGVSWAQYLALLEALGGHPLRHIYDKGHLLMMSPLKEHEWVKRLIGRMIEAITLDQRIPIQSLSSTTILSPKIERSFQADEAYYIASEPKVRGKRTFDAGIDPPPDLVIEVDVTSDSRMQLQLFGRMKVPEVWLYREPDLLFLRRTKSGRYQSIGLSEQLPFLAPEDITKFLERRDDLDESSLIAAFLRHARRLVKKHNKSE